ncbi:MAG: methyl-accepting chemotaxis protein [Alphaproteobacteria bacterium]
MLRRILNRTIRAKLVACFLLFGIVPASAVFGVLLARQGAFHDALATEQRVIASNLIDIVERNLFERYGDVQAFGLNRAATNPANWHRPGEDNPLIRAMNGYMANYGLYKLMLLVSPEGKLLAVNTEKADGKPLNTAALYGRSFADAPWLKAALAGKFLEGRNGFTGTFVEQPTINDLVAKLYGEDGYVITFAAPVKDDSGKIVAVWANFADFGLVEAIVASIYDELARDGMKSAEITILDPAGRVIVDYDPAQNGATYVRNFDIIGKLNLVENGVEAAIRAVRGESGSIIATHSRKKIEQASGYAHSEGAYDYPGLGWSVLVRISADEAFKLWDNTIDYMIIAMAVIVAGILAAGYAIGRRAAQPITIVTHVVERLAEGDKTVQVPFTSRPDELGQMAKAVEVLKENAVKMDRLQTQQRESEKKQLEEQAERQREAEAHAARLAELTQAFDVTVSKALGAVSAATVELQASAQAMTATADKTSRQSSTVAAAAEEATANVETAASAAEELSSSISEITRQVGQSSKIAGEAAAQAERTNATVQNLADAANKVGEVVNLINDIASQTNLLALNATIEAARAGDAGKGFAVVAAEVKTLANQTAKATEEIAAQVASIQGATTDAVRAIGGISSTIGEINQIASTIAAAIEEQGSATQEIARNVGQAADGTKGVTGNIGLVSEAASEVGTAATQVLASAQSMATEADTLKSQVEKFLRDVRAA